MKKLDSLNEEVRQFILLGQWERAEEIWNRLVERSPEDPEVYRLGGDLFLSMNLVQRAISYYLKTLEGYEEKGLYWEAIHLCQKVLQMGERKAEIYCRLGSLYGKENLWTGAVRYFLRYVEEMRDKAEAFSKACQEVMNFLSQNLKNGEGWEEVRRYLEDGLSQVKTIEGGELSLGEETGDFLYEIGSEEEALPEYKSALQEYLSQGWWKRAFVLYQKMAQLFPGESEIFPQLEEVASRDPRQLAELYLFRARSFIAICSLDEAQIFYQKVLENDPKNPEARGALLKISEGEIPRVLSPLEEVIQRLEESPLEKEEEKVLNRYYELGLAYLESGYRKSAIEEFNIAIKGGEKRILAYEALGGCLLEEGDIKGAIRCFREGLKLKGYKEEERQSLHYGLGLAYEKLGDFSLAMREFGELYLANSRFRDVAKRLNTLQDVVKKSTKTPIFQLLREEKIAFI